MSSFSPSSSSSVAHRVAAARRADYVAFLFRMPYAFDAHQLGFATGVREDYSMQNKYDTADVPVFMVDNDFKDPDLERYLEVFREYEPRIGVIGDAYDVDDAQRLVDAARELTDELEYFDPIIVPKCEAALEAIPKEIIVGYPIGYSDIHAPDFTRPSDWAGRRVHILGGSPPKQWAAIQELAPGGDAAGDQSGLSAFGVTSEPAWEPADIVGLDWNGLHGVALKGEYWHHESPHWRRADDLTIRGTVRRGLQHIRRFWRDRGVWPTLTFADAGVRQEEPLSPTDPLCTGCGRDLFDPDEIEVLVEYEDRVTRAYCSDSCFDHAEYHTGLVPLDISRDTSFYTMDRARISGFKAA